jgi:hypothetical protein
MEMHVRAPFVATGTYPMVMVVMIVMMMAVDMMMVTLLLHCCYLFHRYALEGTVRGYRHIPRCIDYA